LVAGADFAARPIDPDASAAARTATSGNNCRRQIETATTTLRRRLLLAFEGALSWRRLPGLSHQLAFPHGQRAQTENNSDYQAENHHRR
jgi:hypothetical protein